MTVVNTYLSTKGSPYGSPSVSANEIIPHPLAAAHACLTERLAEEMEFYERHSQLSDLKLVANVIGRFVYELKAVPTWFAELERRAFLVETHCAEGTMYDQMRQQALRVCPRAPEELCRGRLAVNRLRNSEKARRPVLLAELTDINDNVIEAVLEESSFDLMPADRKTFENWSRECLAIQRHAERLEVDGCWHLYHVYLAEEPDCSEQSRGAKVAVLMGTPLESIQDAADSLRAWIRDMLLTPFPEAGEVHEGPNRLPQCNLGQYTLEQPTAVATQRSGDGPRSMFKRAGEFWHVQFGDEQGNFKPSHGLVYIAHLLGNPHRSVSAQVLRRLTADGDAEPSSGSLAADSQEILEGKVGVTQPTMQEAADAQTIHACRRRLSEIPVEREAARKAGDIDTLDALEHEETEIKGYLANTTARFGRSRLLADPRRSIFNSVKQAIDRAMKKLAAAKPPLPRLHEHLTKSLDSRDGDFEYRPTESMPSWEL